MKLNKKKITHTEEKAGVLASIQASMGTMNLKGELGQGEKEWKLW